MSLPINQDSKTKMNPKFAFELNLDEKCSKGSKFKLFSKQSDGKKEKTFLGSPKLHRVIFHKSSSDAETWKGNSPEQVMFWLDLERLFYKGNVVLGSSIGYFGGKQPRSNEYGS